MTRTARQRRQRQSRNLLLWTGGLFLGVQLLTGLFFDHVFSRARFNTLYRQLDLLAEVPGDPAIICLGSSRTGTTLIDVDVAQALHELGADPKVDVFNLWVRAGDLRSSAYTLEHVLCQGRHPRLVTIEVIPEYFQADYEWREENFLRVLDWRDVFRDYESLHRQGMLGKVIEGRVLPLHVYRNDLSRAFLGLWQKTKRRWTNGSMLATLEARRRESTRVFGEIKFNPPAAKDEHEREWAGKKKAELAGYAIDADAVALLERLLERCEAEGIQALVWTPPFCSLRRECYTAEVNAAFQAAIEHLQERYGFDYYDARACLRDDQMRDTHHASLEGAEYFSRHFCQTALAPAWARLAGNSVLATPASRVK
jgi:uncharacterized protein DUF1574